MTDRIVKQAKDLLTILMPLYGRSEYTKRFLKYWKMIGMPFRLLIVDGSYKSQRHIIGNYLPNESIKYIRCKYDNQIRDFMNKMALAFNNVETPLCAMVDNDDLISIKGYVEGINFLGINKEFIGYRNDVRPIVESEAGTYAGESMYTYGSIDEQIASERLKMMIKRGNACWHNITYTSINKMLFTLMSELEVNDLQLTAKLLNYTNAINGMIYRSYAKPFYFHFPGVSTIQGTSKWTKFAEWPKSRDFIKSTSQATSIIGKLLSLRTTMTNEECKQYFADQLTEELTNTSRSIGIILNKKECKNAMLKESEAYDQIVSKILLSCNGGIEYKWVNYEANLKMVNEFNSYEDELDFIKEFAAANPIVKRQHKIMTIG